jgi:hypothetical protein
MSAMNDDETSKSQAGIGLTQERSVTFGTPFRTLVLLQRTACQSSSKHFKTSLMIAYDRFSIL